MSKEVDPKISIIIPTFNRCHIIGETLNSILTQNFIHWECIVVDDGSSDYTSELMEFYCAKDSRILYHKRPKDRPKGANACRNFGFEMSKGFYIKWFDSDDIMLPDHLNISCTALEKERGLDFVVGNSINFPADDSNLRPYLLNYNLPVTAENFICGTIGWLTGDFMIRRKAVKIRFDERLHSGQEYNFFARLLYENIKGRFLEKDITKRRIHPASIQESLNVDNRKKNMSFFYNEIYLIDSIKEKASEKVIKRSMRRLIRYSYFLTPCFKITRKQIQTIQLLGNFKKNGALLFYSGWMFVNLFLGKGYFLLKNAHRNLK